MKIKILNNKIYYNIRILYALFYNFLYKEIKNIFIKSREL